MYYEICPQCKSEYKTYEKDYDERYCSECGYHVFFEYKDFSLHKLLKPEIMEKVFKIETLKKKLKDKYASNNKSKTSDELFFRYVLEKIEFESKQPEGIEINKLKNEIVKYFEWVNEKIGGRALLDMHYSFDDYCWFNKVRYKNPLRLCELSDKIGWVN